MRPLMKIISALVVFVFICTSVSAENSNNTTSNYDYCLNQCVSLGILKGDDEGIRPYLKITRAEAITAIIRVFSLEEVAGNNFGTTAFKDVPKTHWASGCINTGFIRGIVSGESDGMFYPENNVTRFQLIKMLVCALGYDEAGLQNNYPSAYLKCAADIGLITSEPKEDDVLTRSAAAELLYGSLFVPVLDKTSGKQDSLALRFGVEGKRENSENRAGNTYYMSPTGNDDAQGSAENPWKTLSVAVRRLNAGDTLILEDGTYYEDTPVRFLNGGRKDAPIIVTARNRHGAKIIFGENLCNDRKIINDYGQDYVVVQNLEMTQEKRSTSNTNDIFIAMYGDYNSVLYNKIYYGYEEGIKSHGTKGLTVIGNEVYDTVHESFDVVNVEDLVLANNKFVDWGRVGVMVKGGSRNVKIYNNYVEAAKEKKDTYMPAMGIGIGGSTDNHSGFGIKRGMYEAYNYAVYNNIVYCPTKNVLSGGLAFCGAKDCVAFNNVVYGAKNAVSVSYPQGIRNGWEWNPEVVNPVLYNNIFAECSENAYSITDKPHNMVSDYNLFYKTRTAPVEKHSIYKDPKFVKEGSDFRLMPESPARETGRTMETSIMGYYNEPMYLDLKDYSGNVRDGKWSMGAYAFGAVTPKQQDGANMYGRLLQDGFDYDNAENWVVTNGNWKIENGLLNMTNKDTGRSMIRYAGGLNWIDYVFEADVQVTDSSDKERDSGILFRGDSELKNVYAFRFNRNDKIELCKWTDGSFSSIKMWDYETIPGEFYKMKVSADGDELSLYINGELIEKVTDASFPRGTVGLYAYYAQIGIDNVLVTSN